MGDRCVIVLTVLSLLILSNATVMDSQASLPTDNRLQISENLTSSILCIEFDKSPVPYDSASLDSLINSMMGYYPGLQAVAIKNGQIIWQRSYGYADLNDSTLVTNSHLFYLASVSKPVTATALMQLWENGAFELDDDINDYLDFSVSNPNHPGSAITFRHLLTHTSSISDNESLLDSLSVYGEDCPIPLGEFLENYLQPGGLYYSQNHYSDSAPGADYRYTNVGISLAGYLVEAIADSFPLWCQDSLFGRLGMNETHWFLSCLDTNNIAKPYMWTGTSHIRVPFLGKPHYPAVQLRTSATQLSRFLQAFMQHGIVDTVRILDSLSVALMTTEHINLGGMWMGFSWFYLDYYGRWVWAHDGQRNPGGRTLMAFCPDENSGAIVLANSEPVGPVGTIVDALLDYAEQYTSVEEHNATAPRIATLKVTPNPFTKLTTVNFSIWQSAERSVLEGRESPSYRRDIELNIYDITGRPVRNLYSAMSNAPCAMRISWDGTDQSSRKLPSGVYFVWLSAGSHTESQKLLLVR